MPWRRMGSGCIDPCFLDLDTSWRWVVSFTPRPLYPRERAPWYTLYRRLGRPQSWSGWHGEVKIFYPTGARTLTSQSSLLDGESACSNVCTFRWTYTIAWMRCEHVSQWLTCISRLQPRENGLDIAVYDLLFMCPSMPTLFWCAIIPHNLPCYTATVGVAWEGEGQS
jgi:hypothetical protein